MRIVAGVLLIVTLLVGAFFGYCYFGAQMVIEGVVASVTPALEAPDYYNTIVDQIARETFYGTRYRNADFIMPDGYAFLTLTIRMKNNGLLPQEWIRVEVRPDPADIAQLPENATPTLAAGGRADYSTTLLTHQGVDTQRSVTVTYYVLGRPFTATFPQ